MKLTNRALHVSSTLAFAFLSAACSGTGILSQNTVPLQSQSSSVAPVAPSRSTLFVGDITKNSLDQYESGSSNPKLLKKITTGINEPFDVAADSNGMVYVLNGGGTQRGSSLVVTEYPAGATAPSVTLQLPGAPFYFNESRIAAGPDGTLYVLAEDSNGPVILEYYRGASKPSFIIHADTQPPLGFGPMAVNSENELLLVASQMGQVGILVFPARSSGSTVLPGSTGVGGALTLDNKGNVLAANGVPQHPNIRIIRPGGQFTTFYRFNANYLTFDSTHSMMYAGYQNVTIVDYTTKKIVGTLPIVDPSGLAISPNPY